MGRLKEIVQMAQPFSREAEMAVIGSFIFDSEEALIQTQGRLLPVHFHDRFLSTVFRVCLEIVSTGGKVDAILLSARMDGVAAPEKGTVAEFLNDIAAIYPSASNTRVWVDLMLEKHLERELAHQQGLSAAEKISEAGRVLNNVAAAAQNDDHIVSSELMLVNAMTEIEQAAAMNNVDGVTGLSTGLPDLDKITCGLHAGDLIVIAGRPSMGKTSLALCIAEHLSAYKNKEQRLPSSLISLEMPNAQMGIRWLALSCSIPIKRMRSGDVSNDLWMKMQAALADSAQVPFIMDESPSLTLEQIKARARRMKREHNIALLLIDYLQFISTSDMDPRRSRADHISEISRGIKSLAKELQIPIVLLSQLNRALEQRQDKRPIMSDLRESGAIEQDADLILFIYRDEVYNSETMERGVAEIVVAKQRNGEIGTVKTRFDGATTRFRPQAEESAVYRSVFADEGV